MIPTFEIKFTSPNLCIPYIIIFEAQTNLPLFKRHYVCGTYDSEWLTSPVCCHFVRNVTAQLYVTAL